MSLVALCYGTIWELDLRLSIEERMADKFSSLSSVAPTAPTTQVGEIRFHPEAKPKSGAAPAAAIGRAGGSPGRANVSLKQCP